MVAPDRRPDPCLVVAGNCMSVSTGPVHARNIFRAYLDIEEAVVLMLSECADFDGQRVADEHAPGVWKVHQPGTLGSPESGALVARRRDRTRSHGVRVTLGSAQTSEGDGIRDRFIVTTHLTIDPGQRAWRARFSAGHAPPARAPRARARFMRSFTKVGGVRGGDMNLTARVVARIFKRSQVFGVGVLCVSVPRWLGRVTMHTIPKARLAQADHDGIGVVLWP